MKEKFWAPKKVEQSREINQETANRWTARRLWWFWAQHSAAYAWGLQSSVVPKPCLVGLIKEISRVAAVLTPDMLSPGWSSLPTGFQRQEWGWLCRSDPLDTWLPGLRSLLECSTDLSTRVVSGDCSPGSVQPQGGSTPDVGQPAGQRGKPKCLQNEFLLSHYLTLWPSASCEGREPGTKQSVPFYDITTSIYQLRFITAPLRHTGYEPNRWWPLLRSPYHSPLPS